jgi:hypothetical protein
LQHVSEEKAQDDFNKMIDDMAYKVWACGRCLNMGHQTKDCVNDIRCRACFTYGHIKRNCFGQYYQKKRWVPKSAVPSSNNETESLSLPAVSPSPLIQTNPATSLPSNPVPPTSPTSSASMAVYEVDPIPWLPWGHQVIDGGPTRLPRSYYFPAHDPPSEHQDYCIAVLDPPPPPQAAALWREQVHDFLIGPLQRNVVSIQASLFGVGLFQLNGPNSVNALVQHGLYQLQNRELRFLHVGEAPQNHRAAVGFRRGWLMFLGMHPDYRNNLDIANAVSTFGQFHSWNHHDPIKERALVYASFPSPQLVPRDVVFGKFGTVGGVRESWTAPVFILSADFADVLPADEDQMPLDGNPHPLPGQLMPNNNLFVNPQYPEIGWDAVEEEQGNPDGHHDNIDPQQEEVAEADHEQPVSMVLSMSNDSSSSVNMQGGVPQPFLQMDNPPFNVINLGMVVTRFGPVIPPAMQWRKMANWVLPALCLKTIPQAMKASAFAMLDLNKLPSAWALTGIQGKHLEKWQGGLRVTLLEKNSTNKPML